MPKFIYCFAFLFSCSALFAQEKEELIDLSSNRPLRHWTIYTHLSTGTISEFLLGSELYYREKVSFSFEAAWRHHLFMQPSMPCYPLSFKYNKGGHLNLRWNLHTYNENMVNIISPSLYIGYLHLRYASGGPCYHRVNEQSLSLGTMFKFSTESRKWPWIQLFGQIGMKYNIIFDYNNRYEPYGIFDLGLRIQFVKFKKKD